MKCPHCGQDIGGRKCSSCGSVVVEEGIFCHRCGMRLDIPQADPPPQEQQDDGIDFSKRILCSDGNCIGVVNDEGFCKVCGKAYSGEPK